MVFRKKLIWLLLALLLLPCIPCSAEDGIVWFEENFEQFDSSRWYTASQNIGEAEGNHYAVLNNSDARSFMLQDSASAPGDRFFVSADFMIPTGGSTLCQVLAATYRSGKGEGCHVWYDNGDLKLGWSSMVPPDSTLIATDLQHDRWYNVFAYLDHSDRSKTPTFRVYFGEKETKTSEFVTKITSPASQGCGFLGRWFFAKEASGKDAYLDNIMVTPVTDYETELAFFKDRSCIVNQQEIGVGVTVEERNGISAKDFFFRRGIAFEAGQVYNEASLCLTENGTPIPSDTEVMMRYPDGSVHWLLVSGKVDLLPYEKKQLFLLKHADTPVSATQIQATQNGIVVNGSHIQYSVEENGITSLLYGGKEQLNADGIRLYATVNGLTHYLKADTFSVLKETDSYSKIKISGSLTDTISGEMIITLAEGASKLQIDHRITVTEDIVLTAIGLAIGTDTVSSDNGVVSRDFLNAGDMQLATFDVTRFNKENAQINKTGFQVETNRILFVPMFNGTEFRFYDGMSRTAHLTVGFSETAEDMAKLLSHTPSVMVDGGQYVRAGEILNTETGGLINAAIETFKEEWYYTMGGFHAGAMSAYNHRSASGAVSRNLPGEVEYNLGISYMQTGDEEIFRKLYDASEYRADVAVYRGKEADCYGVMRARVWDAENAEPDLGFFQSHGYYSDEGGLYMAYLLSGDEYLYDTYRLCMEKTLSDMYEREALGGTHVPEYRYWGQFLTGSQKPFKAAFYESRGMIRARTLYLAADLLGDERYREAAYEVIEWAKNAQLPSGAYNQAMYHDGKPLYQTGQAEMPVKDYIALMGFRGISQILDWENNETALEITLKFSDYLCSQGENFGAILVQPNSDKNVYEVNEDGTRAAFAVDNMMAIDVLCTAYEKTGNERYLTWILKFLDSYVAASIGGLGGGCREQGYPGHHGWASDNVRLTTLLRASDNLNQIFNEQKETVIAKGYEHLYYLFGEDTFLKADRMPFEDVPYPRAVYNLYDSEIGHIAYAYNQYVDITRDDISWAQTLRVQMPESNLWYNCRNTVIDTSFVTIEKYLEPREYFLLVEHPKHPELLREDAVTQSPVSFEEMQGTARAYIDRYDETRIEITLQGEFEATVRFETGAFPIVDDRGYTVSVSYIGGTHITITPGGNTFPKDGAISVSVNGGGQRIDKVTASYRENFESYSPGTAVSGSNYGTTVATDGKNRYAVMKDTNLTDAAFARVVKDFSGQPGLRFIVSVDFMIPTGGSQSAELFGLEWFAGKGKGAHLRLEGRDLYTGSSAGVVQNKLLMENLSENKWYRIFAVIDCSEQDPTYQFYIGNTVSEKLPFEYGRSLAEKLIHANDPNQAVMVSRVLSITEKDGNPIYFDNISVTSPKYFEPGVKSGQIDAILKHETPGKGLGEIPPAAFTRLERVYSEVQQALSEKNLTDDEVNAYCFRLDEAISAFYQSKNAAVYDSVTKTVTVATTPDMEGSRIFVAGYTQNGALTNVISEKAVYREGAYQTLDTSAISEDIIKIFVWDEALHPKAYPCTNE